MTKEEILKQAYESHFSSQKYEKSNFGHTYKDVSEQALDQYAEQESISFAEWMATNHIWWNKTYKKWTGVESYTTVELYQLYKKETQIQPDKNA